MIKGTRRTTAYTEYTFSEKEFKDLLGIGDDPHGVLIIRANFATRTVIVTMSDTTES